MQCSSGFRLFHHSNLCFRQKALAEIAETIYTAHMLHRTVVEIPKEDLPTLGKIDGNLASDDGDAAFEDIGIGMHQGNKVG